MTGRAHRLVGFAMTPVHVGDGTVITPEGYRLSRRGARDFLERFDPPAVIARMSDAARDQYVTALAKGGLKQAQEMLRKAAGEADIRERIGVSSRSLSEIEESLRNPLRRGEIRPFVRSGDTPIVPGSSIKGALRTALLAAEAKMANVQQIAADLKRAKPGKTGALSNELQKKAFNFEAGRTEQDPLRDLSVADVVLEGGSTLIDRSQVANLDKDGRIKPGSEGKIQLHIERLASVADDGAFPTRPFALTVATPSGEALGERQEKAASRASGRDRATPRRSVTFDAVRKAANAFHADLWFEERDRFYKGTGTEELLDKLLAAFGLPADREKLLSALEAKGAWLLRLGRFAHFESKSVAVDGERRGEKRGKKGPNGEFMPARFMDHGGSRTVAVGEDGRLLPFGWVLFLPVESAPSKAPRLDLAGTPDAQGHAGPTAPPRRPAPRVGSPSQDFRFRKGDRVTNGEETATVVTDVRLDDDKMNLNIGGDFEWVSVPGWRKLS